MALPEMTDFQKLEILREEVETLRKNLAEVDRHIREIEKAEARRVFLATTSPFYKKAPETEGFKILPTLEAKSVELTAAVAAIEKLLKGFEDATGGGAAPTPQGSAAGRRKFNSFDDFIQSRPD